ncbi:MAG: transporter substrate-binding protein [Enterovirga sp.]|nr:transporter substrate-binding protein [Enterovirga sp.]
MTLSRRTVLLAGTAALAMPAMAQGARVPVRVGYVPVIGAAPLFVMNGAGWAREAGLDLVLTKFESGPPAIQALASGTLDLLFVGIAPIAVGRAKGLPIKVVAASGIGGSGFAVQPALAASFEAHPGKPAEAFAAFRAKNGRPAKLGVLPPGGTPTVALRYWLKRNEVRAEDLQFASMGIEAVQQAMLTGAIDGGTVLEPALTLVQSRKPDVKTIAFAPEMYPNLPGVVVAATESFMAAQPEAVLTTIRLASRARDLILADPKAAAPHIGAVISGGLVDNAIFERALGSKAITFVVDPRTIVDATRDSLAFEVEIGDFATAPPIEGLFDHSWFERALAR